MFFSRYTGIYISGYIRGANEIIKLSKAPVIYHHHVVTDILNEKTIKGKELFDGCRGMLFVSDFASERARSGAPEYDNKISTFLNAIDTSRFNVDNKDEIRTQSRGTRTG